MTPMRVVAFDTEPRVTRRILDHLDAAARSPSQGRVPPFAPYQIRVTP